jgi:hypothetical protein
MTRSIIKALSAVAMLTAATSAQAGGAGNGLGDCYNHVISACNQKQNVDAAHACANSGMNACDKEHRNATPILPGKLLQMRSATLAAVEKAVVIPVAVAPARAKPVK